MNNFELQEKGKNMWDVSISGKTHVLANIISRDAL